jgi:hypothetical protein
VQMREASKPLKLGFAEAFVMAQACVAEKK